VVVSKRKDSLPKSKSKGEEGCVDSGIVIHTRVNIAKVMAEIDRQPLYAAHTRNLRNFPFRQLLPSTQLGRPGIWKRLVGKLYGQEVHTSD
jgi:hypothetical protein